LRRCVDFDAVLHLGTLWLPLKVASGRIQLLYVDSTWRRVLPHLRISAAAAAYAEKLERRSFAAMDHIFTHSRSTKDSLVADYGLAPDAVSVVRSGRGSIVPFYGPKNYANGITLFVAKNRFEQKGGHILINAFRIARKTNPALRLIIVGDDRYAGVPGVTTHRFIPWEKLQELFNAAPLYAMPAPYEPWGLVYIEAMCCRTPILGLNRNAFPELANNGEFGFPVEQDTPEMVAEALLDAHSNPERLAMMGKRGQEFAVRTYTWDKTVSEIVEVARVIVSGPHPARNEDRSGPI
jgi:glycosyltransferase involved in cell wall biosynthesis